MADAQPPSVVQPTRSTNVLGVVGFVLAIVGFNVIAIILGAVALSQIGEKGRVFALAAIWIAIIEIVLFFVILIIVIAVAAATNATIS